MVSAAVTRRTVGRIAQASRAVVSALVESVGSPHGPFGPAGAAPTSARHSGAARSDSTHSNERPSVASASFNPLRNTYAPATLSGTPVTDACRHAVGSEIN